MKHIIKIASLANLPETRPLVAMDNNGNLKCLAKESTPPGPTVLSLTITAGGPPTEDVTIQYE